MKKLLFFSAILFAFVLSSCNESPSDKKVPITNEQKLVVRASNNFGLRLFRAINREEGAKNIVLSPLSVTMALGMTVNGAAGETRNSMLKTLGMDGFTMDELNISYRDLISYLLNADRKVQFELANSIWYRNNFPFKQSFFDLCKHYFNSLVSGLDFDHPNSKDIINSWVEKTTKGKIKEIVDNIEPDIVMFLINAIYFKGSWLYKFDPSKTQTGKFYLLDGSHKDCKMMKQVVYIPYLTNDILQAVDLPYGSRKFSMTIFLPKVNKNVDDLINEMTEKNYSHWISSFKDDSVIIMMPKYKVEYKVKLNEALKNLGMSIAFRSGVADFTGMSDRGKELFIDKVWHKTYINVDEEGTEAAGVTSVEIGYTSAKPTPIPFILDRPFVFVIREKESDAIIFIGKIVDPKE